MINENRIVVCGAARFRGLHIIESLAADPRWEIVAVEPNGVSMDSIERKIDRKVHADMESVESLASAFQGAACVVNAINLHNYNAPRRELMRQNFHWADHIGRAAIRAKAKRLIHVSSATVYGRPYSIQPTLESQPFQPENRYEESKARAEIRLWDLHQREDLPLVVIRPALTYGPHAQYGQALFFSLYSLLKYFGRRTVIAPYGGPRMHMLAVRDLAGAVVTLAEASPHAVEGLAFHAADHTPLSWGSFIQTVVKMMGMRSIARQVLPNPTRRANWLGMMAEHTPPAVVDALNRRMTDRWREMVDKGIIADRLPPIIQREFFGFLKCDHIYDTTALESLGWSPHYKHTVDGLRDTIQWYRDHRWIYS